MANKNIKKENTGQNNGQNNSLKHELSSEVKSLIIVSVAVLLFFGLFYLITVIILDKDNHSKENELEEVEVQHKEILVGTSFSVKADEYYVLYYETKNEDVSSDMYSLVSSYRSSNSSVYLYTVDMSNALNASFKSDEANRSASKASELKISGPTLIKFVDGKINNYVEGIDEITAILK